MDSSIVKIGEAFVALAYIILPFLLGYAHILIKGIKQRRINIFLTYYLCISVGIQGISTGLLQMLAPEMVASITQWNYTPFLIELGMANLCFGLLAFISFFLGQGGKVTAAVGYGLFLLCTGIGHIKNISVLGLSPGDAGGFLFSDFVGGILILLFAALEVIYKPKTEPVPLTEKS